MLTDYVSIDLETTGLNPKTDKIIEIGAVKVCNGVVTDRLTTFVNPGRSLCEKVTELTGITNEDVKEAPAISEVIARVCEFTGDEVLLGQNLIFDYSFLKKAAVNEKLSFERQGVDTLRLARRFLPELESKSLSALCAHYGITLDAHRAYNDAYATHEVFCRLYEEFSQKEMDLFLPKPLCYSVKKEGPITKKQVEQLQRLAVKYDIRVINKTVFLADRKCIPEDQDIMMLTKNEASRLIDRLLATYGR